MVLDFEDAHRGHYCLPLAEGTCETNAIAPGCVTLPRPDQYGHLWMLRAEAAPAAGRRTSERQKKAKSTQLSPGHGDKGACIESTPPHHIAHHHGQMSPNLRHLQGC